MLVRLEDMEDKVGDLIYKYSKDIHYKEVYKKIKVKLLGRCKLWRIVELWRYLQKCRQSLCYQ